MGIFKGKQQISQTIEDTEEASYLNSVLEYIIHFEAELLERFHESRQNPDIKASLINEAVSKYKELNPAAKESDVKSFIRLFESYVWGYYILDTLIADRNISDIKCYSYNNIRIKKKGVRMQAMVQNDDELEKLTFKSEEDYKRFINLIAVKNKVNLSLINAIQSFTDDESSDDFILRFDICTEYIMCNKATLLQIRKQPKFKYSLDDMVDMNVLSPEQRVIIENHIMTSDKGLYITGAGASGKTTLLNTLIEYIPEEKSGLIIQENRELFAIRHPDIAVQRIRKSSGDDKIDYGLKELAINGLLLDIEYYIIGEIKGDEAASFSQASFTGHICWATGHGQSCKDGVLKLADNVARATLYRIEDVLRMLTGIGLVIFMDHFKCKEIAEIDGYDEINKEIKIKILSMREEGI